MTHHPQPEVTIKLSEFDCWLFQWVNKYRGVGKNVRDWLIGHSAPPAQKMSNDLHCVKEGKCGFKSALAAKDGYPCQFIGCTERLPSLPTYKEREVTIRKEERERVQSFIREFVASHILDGNCPFGKMNSDECLNIRDGQCGVCIVDHAIESLDNNKKCK